MAKRKPLRVGEYVTVHMHVPTKVGVCRITSLKAGAGDRYIQVEQVEATDDDAVGTKWLHHDCELKRTKPPKNPVSVIFRQENPHDQLVSITQAIEGNLMNIESRINKSARENLKLQINCLKALRGHIKGVPWASATKRVQHP